MPHQSCHLLQEGGLFSGHKGDSYLTLRNELSEEKHMLTNQEILLGRCAWKECSRAREPGRTALSLGLKSLVLWWWDYFPGFSEKYSFCLRALPGVHTLLSQDGRQWEGFLEVAGHVMSPFDLSQTLPVGVGLLVPCSLPGPPVIKQLIKMVTKGPGQGGRFQSVCIP